VFIPESGFSICNYYSFLLYFELATESAIFYQISWFEVSIRAKEESRCSGNIFGGGGQDNHYRKRTLLGREDLCCTSRLRKGKRKYEGVF